MWIAAAMHDERKIPVDIWVEQGVTQGRVSQLISLRLLDYATMQTKDKQQQLLSVK